MRISIRIPVVSIRLVGGGDLLMLAVNLAHIHSFLSFSPPLYGLSLHRIYFKNFLAFIARNLSTIRYWLLFTHSNPLLTLFGVVHSIICILASLLAFIHSALLHFYLALPFEI